MGGRVFNSAHTYIVIFKFIKNNHIKSEKGTSKTIR